MYHSIYKNISPLILILFFFTACKDSSIILPARQDLLEDYPDLIDIKGLPLNKQDRSVYMFSDLGAWHGFTLPEPEDQIPGTFVGPFIMHSENGIWMTPYISKLSLFDPENNKKISLDSFKQYSNQYYPNKLMQRFLISSGLRVEAALSYLTNRSSVIKYSLYNDSEENRRLQLKWTAMDNPAIDSFVKVNFQTDEVGIKIIMEDTNIIGQMRGMSKGNINYSADNDNYLINIEPSTLQPGESEHFYLIHSFCFSENELINEQNKIDSILLDINENINKNHKIWTDQVESILSELNESFRDEIYEKIAIKSLETLKNNHRSPAGFLTHGGLFPSYNYEWFQGFWSWDSWKHSVALGYFDKKLSIDQIKAMFEFQDSNGMVADCVYRDTLIEKHNFRNTKPPLSAWAIWSIYEKTGDTTFLFDILPSVENYHQWWYKFRDHDQNGLCEYGSTDGSVLAAKWESGMDNAVRFDNAKIVKNAEGAWSLNQESVDLNAYLYAEKLYLAKLFKVKGEHLISANYLADAMELKDKILQSFYDEKSGWFFDIDLFSKEKIYIMGPEGWIPLWAGLVDIEQASKMRDIMLDPSKFATFIPFPTLSADNLSFKPDRGYWRGPVWLDQVYFAVSGFKKYGFEEDAIHISKILMERLDGLKGQGPIYENYHPLSGEGMEAKHFSWSAAHLLLLLLED